MWESNDISLPRVSLESISLLHSDLIIDSPSSVCWSLFWEMFYKRNWIVSCRWNSFYWLALSPHSKRFSRFSGTLVPSHSPKTRMWRELVIPGLAVKQEWLLISLCEALFTQPTCCFTCVCCAYHQSFLFCVISRFYIWNMHILMSGCFCIFSYLSFKAAMFMEHWKRRQMRLNYEWDLTGFEDEEVSNNTTAFLCERIKGRDPRPT